MKSWQQRSRNLLISSVGGSLLAILVLSGQIKAQESEVNSSGGSPTLIHEVQARYTAEALRAQKMGKVVVSLTVDPDGKPTHVRVEHALGMGLDESAINAVMQARFKPALRNGQAVAAKITLEVQFDPSVNPGPASLENNSK